MANEELDQWKKMSRFEKINHLKKRWENREKENITNNTNNINNMNTDENWKVWRKKRKMKQDLTTYYQTLLETKTTKCRFRHIITCQKF